MGFNLTPGRGNFEKTGKGLPYGIANKPDVKESYGFGGTNYSGPAKIQSKNITTNETKLSLDESNYMHSPTTGEQIAIKDFGVKKQGGGYQPTKKFVESAKSDTGVFTPKTFKGELMKDQGRIYGYKTPTGEFNRATNPIEAKKVETQYNRDLSIFTTGETKKKELKGRLTNYTGKTL